MGAAFLIAFLFAIALGIGLWFGLLGRAWHWVVRGALAIGGALLAGILIFALLGAWIIPTVQRANVRADGPNGSAAPSAAASASSSASSARPSAASSAAASASASSSASGNGQQQACPTDSEMQSALGFDKMQPRVRPVATGRDMAWEGCQWIWQSNDKSTLSFNLKSDWQATITRASDGTVMVFYGGPDVNLDIRGMTLRYRPFYRTADNSWVNTPCDTNGWGGRGGLLKRELAFGQAPERGSLTYVTLPGNIDCPGIQQVAGQSGATASTAASTNDDLFKESNTECPRTAQAAADKLGGVASNWNFGAPNADHPYVKWMFSSPDFTTLKYPGWGSYDHWQKGQAFKGPIEGAKDGTFNCTK